MVARPIDLQTWRRREQFEFFRTYLNPYFSITANVDVTRLLELSRKPDGPRFSIANIYLATRAANFIEEFRCRVRSEGAIVHDVVHCNSTTPRADHTFAFARYEFSRSFARFSQGVAETEREVTKREVVLESDPLDDDVLYFSAIPWISFTGFSNAHRLNNPDSVPRIVFGKYSNDHGKWSLPVCVDVHHAVVDGYHVGQFFEAYQQLLDTAETTLVG